MSTEQQSSYFPLPPSGFITVNVGGRLFHTTVETLKLIPTAQPHGVIHSAADPLPGNVTLPSSFDEEVQGSPSPGMAGFETEHSAAAEGSSLPVLQHVGCPSDALQATPTFFSLLFHSTANNFAPTSVSDPEKLPTDFPPTRQNPVQTGPTVSLGQPMFYRNVVTRDSQGHLFIDRDPNAFEHILNYLRTGQIFLQEKDPALAVVQLQHIRADAEFFLLDHLVGVLDEMIERQKEATEKEQQFMLLEQHMRLQQDDAQLEFRVMTVSDVANSTFLSLLNSGKGWKIERIFMETRVVFKCPICAQNYGASSALHGAVVPCTCIIKHEKSGWVTEQVQRALLVRRKYPSMLSMMPKRS